MAVIDQIIISNAAGVQADVVTAGAAAGTKGLHFLGTDGTNARIFRTNSTGQMDIRPLTSADAVTISNASIAVTGTVGISGSVTVTGTVSITANSAINVAQINGITPLMGAGNTGTGSLRVTIATDQAAVPVTISGTMAVNNTQINGVAIVTVAAGVQKMGIADSAGASFLSAANALNSTGTGVQTAALVAQFDDVSPTVITENQFGNLRMSSRRELYTSQGPQVWAAAVLMQNAAAANGNGTSLDVSGCSTAVLGILGAASPSMTVNVEGTFDDSTWFTVLVQNMTSGSVGSGTLAISAAFFPFRVNVHGLKSIRARISSYAAGNVTINGYRQPVGDAFTNAVVQTASGGSLNVQIVSGAGYTSTIVDETGVNASDALAIGGGTPNDSVDSGNPVKIGFKAKTTNPTPVTDGDRVDAMGDKVGRQVVVIGQSRELVAENTTTITTTTETTILAQAASTFHDIAMLTVANTSGTDVRVDFRDTTGGAVRFSMQCKAGLTTGFVNPKGIKQTTVNTNWTATLSAAVDVRIFIQADKNV